MANLRSFSPQNMNKTRGIVWFRSDLRLHDNEALTDALTACDEIMPVYVFDERLFHGKTESGFDKISALRSQFIIESIQALRQRLLDVGSQLVVAFGKTEDILIELARSYKTKWVFCNRERTREEVVVQDAVEHGLWTIGQEIRYTRGKMLLYTADLPFPVTHTPDRFTTFKKEVAYIPIRNVLATPSEIPTVKLDMGYGAIPNLDELNKTEPIENMFEGGEPAGLEALESVISDIKSGRALDNEILSPWISHGCLSPKQIYKAVKSIETRKNATVIDEINVHLLRRDHLRLMGKKFGDLIFHRGGIQQIKVISDRDDKVISAWCAGRTDQLLVNAAMRQLVTTGYLPHRLRVLAGSYFIHDLKQDWLVGAQFFESHLIDYDPCSNYGNWNRLAGVGAVKRDEVQFNMEHQMKLLDPEGAYVEKWMNAQS